MQDNHHMPYPIATPRISKPLSHTVSLVAMSLLLLIAIPLRAQEVTEPEVPWNWQGKWWSAFMEESYLPLYLTFQPQVIIEEAGPVSMNLVPLLMSPLQSDQAIAPTQWSYRHDSLRFEQQQLGLRLTLVLQHDDSSLVGTFRQGLTRTILHFTPCDSLYSFPRPQTPQEPYCFIEEPVSIKRHDAQGHEIELSGSLTLPKPTLGDAHSDHKRYPAVLLVSGSGQQDRDETLFKHKPFLVLADYLAAHGYAVLRYDDRGVGASTGDLTSVTTLDFADDAEAFFQYLRHHPRIQSNRVSIMGHSEGGVIAAIIASRNRKVHNIIMLAGPSYPGRDVLLQQNEAMFTAAGVSPSLVQTRVACCRDCFDTAQIIPSSEYYTVFDNIIQHYTANLSPAQRDSIGFGKGSAFGFAQQLQHPWMLAFLTLDPMQYLTKSHCPVYALYGGRDTQVPATANSQRLAEIPNVQTLVLPDLNHLFQPCTTGLVREYLFIETTMDPQALQTCVDWLNKENPNRPPRQAKSK